jgi:hypothetical protein
VINYSNWDPKLTRILYDVVRNGCPETAACFPTTPAYEATALKDIFEATTGWMCSSETAEADILSYGFGNLGSNCGDLSAGT